MSENFPELKELSFPKSLGSDNHSGIHPEVLSSLIAANHGHAHSYGMDLLSDLAQKEFDRVFERKTFVNYVFNGTAANVLSLASSLKSFEAIICSEQAHLNLDECGAPEALARTKLIPLPSDDGKIRPHQAGHLLHRQGDQHHVQIKMISLTQPTETGVIYSLDELKAWKNWADKHGFLLHCDGARLANACYSGKVSLKSYAEIFDLISFGGTKNGLLGAEAVVCFSKDLAKDLKFYRKQLLNLPSKTRFLAAQFYAYLKNDLYLKIAEHVCTQAKELEERLKPFEEIRLSFPVQSNAVFVELPKSWTKDLKSQFFFYIWEPSKNMARLMIGFDWTSEDTEQFVQHLHLIKDKENENV